MRPASKSFPAAATRFRSALMAVALISLWLPASGFAQDPAFRWEKPILWDAAVGPAAREHGSIVMDETTDRVIVVSGSGYSPYLSPLADVWQFSLRTRTWKPLRSVGTIPLGGSRRVAQIPGTKTAYLFGGYLAGAKTQNELIKVDFSRETPVFTAVPQDNAPEQRAMHAFIYDPVLHQFLLFGGVSVADSGATIHNDVWTMKIVHGRAVWHKLALNAGPSPRYGFFYGFDPALRQLVIFSGAQAGAGVDPAQDTWFLSLRGTTPAWTKWPEASPPGRRNGAFIYDPLQHRLLIFGGTKDEHSSEPDLWTFDARPGSTGWKKYSLPNAPALRSSDFGFLDRNRKRFFIGFGNGAEPYPDLYPLEY